MDYKTSGVDIEAGREFVSEIKEAVEGTHTPNVIEGIGGFGGLFRIPIDSYKKPENDNLQEIFYKGANQKGNY